MTINPIRCSAAEYNIRAVVGVVAANDGLRVGGIIHVYEVIALVAEQDHSSDIITIVDYSIIFRASKYRSSIACLKNNIVTA